MKRENFMKNFVMRRLIDIRIQKRKPKLSDIMKLTRALDMSNPKVKEDFKKRFLALYEGDDNKNEDTKVND